VFHLDSQAAEVALGADNFLTSMLCHVKCIHPLAAKAKVFPPMCGTKHCYEVTCRGLAPRFFSSSHRPLSTIPQILEREDPHRDHFRYKSITNHNQDNEVELRLNPSFRPHPIQSPQFNYFQRTTPTLSFNNFIDLIPRAIQARRDLSANEKSDTVDQHQATHDPVLALFRYV
jgi:hypothetical protein